MDQDDKKNITGAPSSDATSALFVSARKKQLEQQEAEQKAKEKEEQRLAAEAEVRRLEAEVEERRRKAEEDAKHADEEARRIAEEARLKKAQAAENPDAVLGSQPQTSAFPKKTAGTYVQSAGQDGGVSSAFKNKKLLTIIGGGVAAAIIVVVLVITMGGGVKPVTASGFDFGGVWYLDYQDGYYDTFTFFAEGELSFESYDGTIEAGTYEVSGEEVICALYDDSLIFTADGYALYNSEYGFALTREMEDPAPGYEAPEGPVDIDPDAGLNASAIIEGLGMIIKYPDTIFDGSQLSDGRLTLVSLDGYASVAVCKGSSYESVTEEDMRTYMDKTLQKVAGSLPGEAGVIDSGFVNEANSYPFIFFKLSYSGEGEERYLYWFTSLWTNERTGAKNYLEATLDCPEILADKYTALFDRIKAAKDDA